MKNLLICFILTLVLYNCTKDDETGINQKEEEQEETTTPNDISFRKNFGKSIKVSFEGYVKNVWNVSVANAKVIIGDKTVFTDKNGFFKIDDAQVFEFFSYIKVTAGSGYSNKTIVPVIGKINKVNIVLNTQTVFETVSSGKMSEIKYYYNKAGTTLSSKIILPGDYINASGVPYTGEVRVYIQYLEPNTDYTFRQMPGMLLAQDTENNLRGLETYGMLSVKLYSTEGESLNIASDSKATLEFPIDASTPNAPETIPLWYFDEEVGYWKEEGQAIKTGEKYIGEVSHFTWWNCDVPISEVVNGCISFAYPNSTNLLDNWIEIIKNDTNQTIFGGTIDANGEICGLLPKAELTVNIYTSICDKTLIHSQEITPSETNKTFAINLGDLPPSIYITNIIGAFTNCIGNPITNGDIIIQKENTDTEIIIPITESNFNYDLVYCPEEKFNIRAIDYDTELTSELITLNLEAGTIDLGNISTCANGSGIYNGDVTLNTQAQVDAFGQFRYEKIDGNLLIGFYDYEDVESDIVDLKPLGSLVEIINGALKIQFNPLLNSLEGLDNLASIKEGYNGLSIIGNQSLVSLQGLNSLTSLSGGFLSIKNNGSLTSLDGVENLSEISVGSFIISDNPSLTSVQEFNNTNFIGNVNFTVENNYALGSLDGINLGDSVTSILIADNFSLSSIEALSNIKTVSWFINISHNSSLTSLQGLHNLSSISSLSISANANLVTLSGLDNLSSISSGLTIDNNANLLSLSGLENLTYCGHDLSITNNTSLTSIKALSNTKFKEYLVPPEYRGPVLKIIGNNSLISLDGLEGLNIIYSYLKQVDRYYTVAYYSEISDNPKLISIDALKNVVIITTPFTIKNNNALETLNGLDNLEFLPDSTDGGNLNILDCKSLNDYCAFQESFYQNPENNKKFKFSGNKYNPTVENLIDGNCSR